MRGDGAVLVVGADGLLGSAVAARLEGQGRRVIRTSRRGTPGTMPLDLAALPATWAPPPGTTAAVLCAAITSTDECRSRPAESRRVNVEATCELGRRLADAGSRIVFLSTNLVFDGSTPFTPADAPRSPKTAYGSMKAEAEERLLALGSGTTVVRLTKVICRSLPVIDRWRHTLRRGQPIHPASDLRLAPVSLSLAAMVVASAVNRPIGDKVQLSARADITYADVATRLGIRWNVDPHLIRPATAHELGLQPEHVPRHTTLDCSILSDKLLLAIPDPWDAIGVAD